MDTPNICFIKMAVNMCVPYSSLDYASVLLFEALGVKDAPVKNSKERLRCPKACRFLLLLKPCGR